MDDAYGMLKPHVRTGKKIRVERNRPSNPRLNGYLMQLSDTLGVMHCFDDFEPDGYTVFRLEDLKSVRSNEYERHWDRMLQGENLLGGLSKPMQIDLGCIRTAIESVSSLFHLVTVQCEDCEEALEDFYVGRMVSGDEQALLFDAFDALGQWHERSSVIFLDEITMVQFDTPYIRHFSKYLTGSPTGDLK